MKKTVCVSMTDKTIEMVDKMREILTEQEGEDPGMARTIRIAVAEKFKRMTNEGKLKAAK